MDKLTNLSLAARLLRLRMSLPTLLHYLHSPIYYPQWILYCQYTIKGHCSHVPFLDDAIGAPIFNASAFIESRPPELSVDMNHPACYWESAALMPGLENFAINPHAGSVSIRKDIVLGGLIKEGMEMTKLSLRKIDSSIG